jgi:hypothetical protein
MKIRKSSCLSVKRNFDTCPVDLIGLCFHKYLLSAVVCQAQYSTRDMTISHLKLCELLRMVACGCVLTFLTVVQYPPLRNATVDLSSLLLII